MRGSRANDKCPYERKERRRHRQGEALGRRRQGLERSAASQDHPEPPGAQRHRKASPSMPAGGHGPHLGAEDWPPGWRECVSAVCSPSQRVAPGRSSGALGNCLGLRSPRNPILRGQRWEEAFEGTSQGAALSGEPRGRAPRFWNIPEGGDLSSLVKYSSLSTLGSEPWSQAPGVGRVGPGEGRAAAPGLREPL